MKNLFEAIYIYYKQDPLSSVLTDLYNTTAPSKAIFPYGVFSLVSDTPNWTFTENYENCLIQFNIFSKEKSSLQACNIFEAIKGDRELGIGFDFLDLELDNYTLVSLLREVSQLVQIEDVWQYNITYRILLQKDPTASRITFKQCLYNLMSI